MTSPIGTPLTRFLARHALIGFGIALLFAGMLLGLDVAGLRTLVTQSPVGLIATGALTFLLGLTFASVQMGIAVMQLEAGNTPAGTRRRTAPGAIMSLAAEPVPVRVRRR